MLDAGRSSLSARTSPCCTAPRPLEWKGLCRPLRWGSPSLDGDGSNGAGPTHYFEYSLCSKTMLRLFRSSVRYPVSDWRQYGREEVFHRRTRMPRDCICGQRAEAFRLRTLVMEHWRRFPLIDVDLPEPLLPRRRNARRFQWALYRPGVATPRLLPDAVEGQTVGLMSPSSWRGVIVA